MHLSIELKNKEIYVSHWLANKLPLLQPKFEQYENYARWRLE